ncbi:MAG: hypothetical protein LUQ31_09925 [Methanoregula sp.]|nr:hypothetical protein [Methanoregula sp.]
MRLRAIALLCVIIIGLITPAIAVNDERYGYITVDAVKIRLDNDSAVIHVNYSVDEGTRFIFFLLGKQDLQSKLLKILNYDEADMKYIDLTDADFIVPHAAYSYGNGIYWYPSHEFNVLIPKLTVESPQVVRNYTNSNLFPGGMGYFGTNTSMVTPDMMLPESIETTPLEEEY